MELYIVSEAYHSMSVTSPVIAVLDFRRLLARQNKPPRVHENNVWYDPSCEIRRNKTPKKWALIGIRFEEVWACSFHFTIDSSKLI